MGRVGIDTSCYLKIVIYYLLCSTILYGCFTLSPQTDDDGDKTFLIVQVGKPNVPWDQFSVIVSDYSSTASWVSLRKGGIQIRQGRGRMSTTDYQTRFGYGNNQCVCDLSRVLFPSLLSLAPNPWLRGVIILIIATNNAIVQDTCKLVAGWGNSFVGT